MRIGIMLPASISLIAFLPAVVLKYISLFRAIQVPAMSLVIELKIQAANNISIKHVGPLG
jgi:hypothetical protein